MKILGPRDFYDDLARDYHLIFEDWNASVRRQGAIIHSLLGGKPQRVLDVACGMGTQALGLAQLGHLVTARDLSQGLVDRAREEAQRLGVALDVSVGDMRTSQPADHGAFHAVIAFDNALPHLETDADLTAAMVAAHSALRPGGKFLASVRDYDALVRQRPRCDPLRRFGAGSEERVVLQLWDWDSDGRGYQLQHITLVPDGYREWQTRTRRAHYRALLRHELSDIAAKTGFEDGQWIESEASGFYQPIFVAAKPLASAADAHAATVSPPCPPPS